MDRVECTVSELPNKVGSMIDHDPNNLILPNFTRSIDFVTSNGRLCEKKLLSGMTISFLWSYNNTYPIARIEDATFSQVEEALGGPSVVSSLTSSLSNTYINTTMSALRSALPNTLITTYTYDPLIGMTSQTDPNGRTTYYQYDSFGRLEFIRDQDYNIIKKYEYKYASETTN